MAALKETYARWGALVILVKGLTPIPYKLVTIVSGLLGYNFALCSVALLHPHARGARFFILAGVLHRFGDPLKVSFWSVISRCFSGFSPPSCRPRISGIAAKML